jgi:cyclopropane fatty-acyl-phospholipid synthase-like methyltransferase
MAAAPVSSEYTGRTCSAPAARSDRMRDLVLANVPVGGAVRVLDIGCGTGSLLFRLAEALPAAALVGIDVSPANIRAAKREQANRPAATHAQFEVADYLEYRAEPFEVVVSDGVLHLIPGETTTLVGKLAADLRPGGVLVCDMPFDCWYNRAFAVVRRVLRALRSPWLDRLILQAGRMLHGRQMDDEGLRERVAYMYVPPERMMSDRLAASFASAGLRRTREYAMQSASPSQLRHRVTIFVRDAN